MDVKRVSLKSGKFNTDDHEYLFQFRVLNKRVAIAKKVLALIT